MLVAMSPADEDPPCLPEQPLSERVIDRLFRSEAPRLARFIRRSVHNHDEVHDLVQETFANFAATAATATLRKPEAYLRTIARNLLWGRWKKSIRRHVIFVPVEEALGVSVEADQSWMMEATDLKRRYEQALSELPSRTREVFRLHRQEELPYQAIADQLGMTVRGVKYHMRKALLYLDHRINSDG